MESDADIPVLTDLIELGTEITMSDLGFDEDMQIIEDPLFDAPSYDKDSTEPNLGFNDEPAAAFAAEPVSHNSAAQPVSYASAVQEAAASTDIFANNPGLEQRIRRILDDHMELAFLEIKQAIRNSSKSS
ncbi:MAG: hypothetical protein ACI9LO_003354 [Planctomycetota bacterium]|jgi:hypothetical protein